MSAEDAQGNTGDDAELARLRRRAYGPQPDIQDDPVALARLDDLEAVVRSRFAMSTVEVEDSRTTPPDPVAAPAPVADASVPSTVAATPPSRARRAHTALLVTTATAALLLGAIAWSAAPFGQTATAGPGAPAPAPADTAKPIPVVEDQDWSSSDDRHWSASSAADYTRFLDSLRDELLAGEGMGDLPDRVIRKDLRPYGSLYGHTVWAGSTIDGEYCMIIVEQPLPEIACISVDEAYASPRTIVLPAGVADSAAEAALEPGAPISYTLLPGGTVVAEPSDAWNFPLDD